MSLSKWWGTTNQLGDGAALTADLDKLFAGSTVMANAEPLTIRVHGVMGTLGSIISPHFEMVS